LINTSRGPIVDEAALINALLLPHIGYVTSDNYRTFYRQAVEDIVAFTAGTPVRELSPNNGGSR